MLMSLLLRAAELMQQAALHELENLTALSTSHDKDPTFSQTQGSELS